MELLLILIYVSICYAIFKIFRIPVNQWSLATAALGGHHRDSLLLLIMNYNHPFTTNARIYFAVTPVLPSVKGRVIEVPARPTRRSRKAMCCFGSIPAPYQYVVDQKKAALAEAEQNVQAAQGRLSIRRRLPPKRPMRSASWRSRTMIARPNCSKRRSSRRPRSTPLRAIWKRRHSR